MAPMLALAVIAAACSSGESPSATASVAASVSAAASASASASAAGLAADEIFSADVPGYDFVKLPKSIETQARKGFYSSSGLSRDDASVDMQSVTKDGASVGVLMVVTLSPQMAALPGTNAQTFATGIAQTGDSKPQKVSLGPTDGYVVDSGGQIYVAWQDQNLLIAMIGQQEAASVAAARAIAVATLS